MAFWKTCRSTSLPLKAAASLRMWLLGGHVAQFVSMFHDPEDALNANASATEQKRAVLTSLLVQIVETRPMPCLAINLNIVQTARKTMLQLQTNVSII